MVRLPRHRPGWKPAVLADGQADAHAVELDDRAPVPGLEVALFVEHSVVGQEHLVVDGFDLSVVHERGGVEKVSVLVHETDDGRDAFGRAGHDLKLLEPTLDSIPIKRPKPTKRRPQGLCLDRGYDYKDARLAASDRGLTPHVRTRGEEIKLKAHTRAGVPGAGSSRRVTPG